MITIHDSVSPAIKGNVWIINYTFSVFSDMVKQELRVTSCELRVTSYELKA